MHRSSKQRRSRLIRRWKRALFVAACAASFATSSFLFAEESAPAKKRLPIKSVTLPQMPMVSKEAAPGWWKDRPDPVVRQLAPIVGPEEAKRSVAKSETPAEPSSRRSASESPAKLLGAKVSPFRPVAIEAVPPQAEEMRSDVIQPEEKQVVASPSVSRPGQKPAELTPVELKGAGAEQQDVAAAPLSPWMQDVRAPQSEATTSQEDIAPAAPTRLPKSGSSPFLPVAIQAGPDQTGDGEVKAAASAPLMIRLPAVPQPEVKAKPIPSKLQAVESQPEETLAPIVAASSVRRPGLKPVVQKPVEQSDAPAKLPTVGLSVFQRAATPAVSEVEVAGAEAPVQTPEEPAEQARQQELAPAKLAPLVLTPKAEPLVQEAPEPGRLSHSSKPVRAKPPARGELKSEPLILAVQNEAAQPKAAQPADPLPGPDKDADLKKHFEVIQQSGEFSVQVHRSKLLRTAKDIYRTAVVDDAVLEIVQFTPREISLIGRSQGSTHVTFWFDDPALQPVTYLVTVEPDAGQVKIDEEKYQLLEDMINGMFPDSKIHLQLIANKLVVRGQARDSEEAFQIMTIIRAQGGFGGAGGMGGGFGGAGFAGINEGPAADALQDSATGAARRSNYQLINMLRVPGVQQVALRVKIAELNRTAARNFGMNVQGRVDITTATNGSKILLNSILGGGSTGGVAGVQTAPAILANFDGNDIAVGLNTLSQHGVIKLLSEPTLVTLSGNPATFIAGGEFAVPTIVGSAGLNAVTTDFRAFGAIISFLPTVVDKDRIRLQVAPEFSQINSGLTVNGTPGLKVRAATTTVEMREGQTLAIAGLLEDNMNANTAGDIPFLSKWIGRRGVTKAETELIILVTPELVHPMEPEEVPPLPGFDVSEPTNSQFYIHGDIEGNPTMDYRSTVWPRLKKRYKAGGPAMTSGPFGHGQ